MAKIYLKNRGRMPDIPEKFKDLYDKDKMLFLLKGKKLTRKELIEKCKENNKKIKIIRRGIEWTKAL